jgi:hypothetical protein
MRQFIKMRVILTLLIIPMLCVWGTYEYLNNGETGILKIALITFIIHVLLYFFVVRRKKQTT